MDFYGSKGDIIKNEIGVIVGRKIHMDRTKTFFDIPSFLAFKEYNRTIKLEDKLNYRFKLNPSEFNSSISKSLNKNQF